MLFLLRARETILYKSLVITLTPDVLAGKPLALQKGASKDEE
jgi:hypothetical protein